MRIINSFKDQYSWLSNMYPVTIEFGGCQFTCAEAAYQAMKTRPGNWEDFTSIDGYQAKKLGRKVSLPEDWNQRKIQVMKTILRYKFKNLELRALLLSTKDALLEEGNTWGDTFWGTCNGKGDNMLGRLLMEVREEIFNYGITTAVVGSRTFINKKLIFSCLDKVHKVFNIVSVVSGGAKGPDTIGMEWAESNGILEVEVIPAEWDIYGKSAGFRRNQHIVDSAELIIAFWDEKSRGTKDTMDKAKKDHKLVYYFDNNGEAHVY